MSIYKFSLYVNSAVMLTAVFIAVVYPQYLPTPPILPFGIW